MLDGSPALNETVGTLKIGLTYAMRLFPRLKPKKKKKKKDPKLFNPYSRELTEEEISKGEHRTFVGGKWDEFGPAQLKYLSLNGLSPSHRLLDVGCGALRGGIHFIRHLDAGNYYGIDMNKSLIKAAREIELANAGLTEKRPDLRVNGAFEFGIFQTTFHYAIAFSVFTHIPVNAIERCLVNMAAVLEPGGQFFATYFEAPSPHHLQPILQSDGIITTYSDQDPFHYHFSLFPFLLQELPLKVENLGSWEPRGLQHMLRFTKI